MEVNILKWAVTFYPKLLKASWFQSLSLGGKRPINFKKMTNISLGELFKSHDGADMNLMFIFQ